MGGCGTGEGSEFLGVLVSADTESESWGHDTGSWGALGGVSRRVLAGVSWGALDEEP